MVRERLLDLIEGLAVGAAMPPERQLSTDLGVARMTLRRAMDDLVAEGYLSRQHGRGTFVAEPKISQPLTMTSFSEDMRRRGMEPNSRTLSVAITTAGARVGRRLETSPGERILKVSRLRLADGEPMAIETLHVPARLVPGLTGDDLEGASFYDLLASRYGIVLTAGTQTIEPSVASEDEADVLGVPVLSPVFLFERVARDAGGRVVEFVVSVYRGDRYKLTAELTAPRARTAAVRVARETRGEHVLDDRRE
jgi:GntR family transcriptional regulator